MAQEIFDYQSQSLFRGQTESKHSSNVANDPFSTLGDQALSTE